VKLKAVFFQKRAKNQIPCFGSLTISRAQSLFYEITEQLGLKFLLTVLLFFA
jgi:hypothetical protein